MRWLYTRWLPGLALVGALLGAGAPAGAEEDAGPSQTPACVHWRAYAVYDVGYNHIVDIDNTCDQMAQCHVSTNVDPQDHPVAVPAGEEREVVTRRGSPASAFTAHVRCTLGD